MTTFCIEFDLGFALNSYLRILPKFALFFSIPLLLFSLILLNSTGVLNYFLAAGVSSKAESSSEMIEFFS